jgi:hypothetical protein
MTMTEEAIPSFQPCYDTFLPVIIITVENAWHIIPKFHMVDK